jgi:hypothetical protein
MRSLITIYRNDLTTRGRSDGSLEYSLLPRHPLEMPGVQDLRLLQFIKVESQKTRPAKWPRATWADRNLCRYRPARPTAVG